MATITIQDIAQHRELIGSTWAKSHGVSNPSFADMNLKKLSDDPEEYYFDKWTVDGVSAPTQAQMLTILKADLDAEIALYSTQAP